MNLRAIVNWIFKGVVTIGLFYYLITTGKLDLGRLGLLIDRPGFFGLLLAGMFLVFLPLNTWRWRLFLGVVGLNQPFRRIHGVCWIGFFFNTALPGAVTGDLVKALYVIQPGEEGQKTKALTSLVLDRFTGLFGLVVMASLSLAFNPHWLNTPGFSGIGWVIVALAGFTICFYSLVLIRFPAGKDPVIRLLTKMPLGPNLISIYRSFKQFEDHPAILFQTLFLTVIIHSFVASLFYLLCPLVGIESMELLPQMLLMPLGLIATVIPLAPGGAGLGHAAFDQLYGLYGYHGGADVFNFYMILQILAFMPGALIYFSLKTKIAPAKGRV